METRNKIEYSTTIKAPVGKVWKALTDANIVRQYFFGSNLRTSWEKGEPIYFEGEWEGKQYQDKGEVLDYQPEKFLRFSYLSDWSGKPDHPDNYLEVSYTVEPRGNETILTVTQTNYDQEKADHSKENWKMVMEGMRKLVENP